MNQVASLAKRMFLAALIGLAIVVVSSAPLRAQPDAEDNYNKKCAVCHGKDGAGNTAKGKQLHVKDVHEYMKSSSEADMIKAVTDGKGETMDAYKDQFTADQIKAIVQYYRSLAK
jgi:mono/diheme cytochrome c family protein